MEKRGWLGEIPVAKGCLCFSEEMDALSITGGNTVVNINIGDGGMLEAAEILAKQTIM